MYKSTGAFARLIVFVLSTHLGPISQFNLKFVLQHNHVPLSSLVLHFLLKSGAEGVKEIALAGDRGGGEEAEPEV